MAISAPPRGGLTLGDATTGGTLATAASFDSARTVTLESGGGTVDTANGVTTGLTGQITGAGTLTKDGTGTLILSGVNNYGGGTTVSAGTLQGDTGSLQGDITDNANVTFNQSTAGSYGGVLSGSGSLTKSGSGNLTLSRTNLYTGDTNVTGGTLSISSDANLGNGGKVNLAEGTTLSFTTGGTYTHDVTVTGDPIFDTNGNTVIENGQITDGGSPPSGEVVVTGGGTLVLGNANNSYSGGTKVIEGSTVSINNNGDLGALTGGLTLGDTTTSGTLATGNLSSGRLITLGAGGGRVDVADGTTATLSGAIGGAGGLTKLIGTGTLILTGASSYTGATTVIAGTLELGPGGSLASSSPLIVSFGVFDLENGGQTVAGLYGGDGTVNLGNGNLTLDVDQGTTANFAGVITGSGGLIKMGAGRQELVGGDGYAGVTQVDAGTLQVSGFGTLASTAVLIVNGGSLELESVDNQVVSSLTGTADGTVTIGAFGLTVNQSTTTTFAGSINGIGVLDKTGAGTLILTGAGSYAGATEIDAGTLRLGPGGSVAPTTELIVNGGTFDLENGGQTVADCFPAAGAPSPWAAAVSLWTRSWPRASPARSPAPGA